MDLYGPVAIAYVGWTEGRVAARACSGAVCHLVAWKPPPRQLSLSFWLVGNSYLGIISGLSVAHNQVMEAMLKPGLVN